MAPDFRPPEDHVPLSDPDWDALVTTSASPHIEQYSAWGELQRTRGWTPVRFVVFRHGVPVGGAQWLQRRVGRIARIGYLPRGPLLFAGGETERAQVIADLKREVRRRWLWYLAVTPAYDGEGIATDLGSCGFRPLPPDLPPLVTMTGTQVLSLEPPLEQIFAGFRSTVRNYIRQGERKGTRVRWGGVDDVPQFARLLEQLCARLGTPSNIGGLPFIAALWSGFAPQGRLKLLLTECEGRTVAAMLLFVTGRWARGWRVGASGEGREGRPNEVMWWEAIKAARAAGCTHFDFVGFDAPYAQAIAEGREVAPEQRPGASYFKLGFGGKVMPLAPGWYWARHPLVPRLLRRFGRRGVR